MPLSRNLSAVLGVLFLVVALMAGGWAASTRRSVQPPPIGAYLRVEPVRSALGRDEDAWATPSFALLKKTHQQLVRSPNVCASAAIDLETTNPRVAGRRPDPVAWLREGIKVDDLEGALLFVSMPGEPRDDQAEIVNAVVRAYAKAAREWDLESRERRLGDIERIYAKYREGLAERRKALRDAEQGQAEAEILQALRDQVAIREEMARRLGLAAEERRLELDSPTTVRLMDHARSTPDRVEGGATGR